MKLQYKKYLYLINDISNILLNKELQKRDDSVIKRLKNAVIILSIVLAISMAIIIYLVVTK